MSIRVMDDSQGPYSHEEEIIVMHVIMGNVETDSNGRTGRHEHVTMRTLHREVQSYRDDNERIMKAWDEIIQILNMFHKQVNKYYDTKQEANVRQVSASRSQSKRDDHGNDRHSRSMSKYHHSLRKSTRRTHAISGLEHPKCFPCSRENEKA
jgi:hypothetical protein